MTASSVLLSLLRARKLIKDSVKRLKNGKTLRKYSCFISGSQEMLCEAGYKRLNKLFGELSINVDWEDSPVTLTFLRRLRRKLQKEIDIMNNIT